MESEKAEITMEKMSRPKRRWRRATVATSIVAGMLFSGAVILPTAVMNSAYRDSVLNSRLEPLGLTAVSESGSGNWVTQLELRNIRITDETGQIKCRITKFRSSKSLLSLLLNGGDLGTFTVVEPHVQIALDENGELAFQPKERAPTKNPPDVAFDIQDAAISVSVPWREMDIIDVDRLDISGSVATADDGRWLSIDPVQIFDHEEISDAHTEQNLALIAPILAQSTALSGQVSVKLDATKIRLDAAQPAGSLLRGEAIFHTVEARLKQDWTAQVAKLLGQATGVGPRDRLQVARDTLVTFEYNDQGVYHHGLAFLLPELANQMQIESSGLVALDESLDLTFAVQMAPSAPGGAFMSILSKMVSSPIKLYVRGTVSEPKLEAPAGLTLVDQLSKNVAPEQHTEEPPSVPESVMKLINSSATPSPEQGEDITGGILNIIRAAREAKANAPEKEPRVRKRKRSRL